MTRPGRDEDPDRLYTVTGGRSRADTDAFDLVTLVVSEAAPGPGMQREHAAILRICRTPTSVAELASDLRMPVSVVRILLGDLLLDGHVTVRHPRLAAAADQLPNPDFLKQVLVGLRNL